MYQATTFGVEWCSPTVQSHDYWSKSHVSLHSVFPDGINDEGREGDVEVTKKHNAVLVLRES